MKGRSTVFVIDEDENDRFTVCLSRGGREVAACGYEAGNASARRQAKKDALAIAQAWNEHPTTRKA